MQITDCFNEWQLRWRSVLVEWWQGLRPRSKVSADSVLDMGWNHINTYFHSSGDRMNYCNHTGYGKVFCETQGRMVFSMTALHGMPGPLSIGTRLQLLLMLPPSGGGGIHWRLCPPSFQQPWLSDQRITCWKLLSRLSSLLEFLSGRGCTSQTWISVGVCIDHTTSLSTSLKLLNIVDLILIFDLEYLSCHASANVDSTALTIWNRSVLVHSVRQFSTIASTLVFFETLRSLNALLISFLVSDGGFKTSLDCGGGLQSLVS